MNEAARREELETQMRAECKRETLLKKERVVNSALLKGSYGKNDIQVQLYLKLHLYIKAHHLRVRLLQVAAFINELNLKNVTTILRVHLFVKSHK